ncbi:FkbM family methyltransferase [Sphingomonas crocodyli]|uniref:FkbM family methyltransferase n=1 Tax=Sphingomonas crocodyli TaxID=1979270 RepID=A0A437MBB4_9SPHN|nr:FkbM family methyltransferase [Sphingomonas crocodyli]RVT94937.1 FkbM family methyltransferase [Sphingomonas crocodyli]
MGIISYAQNFEDVILWRALGHIENGTYIDVGAHHPDIDSVSKAFYDRGWRGIHVEPGPSVAQLLREKRPGDTVIQAMISDVRGVHPFYETPGGGLSTADGAVADFHVAHGNAPVSPTNAVSLTLDDILDQAQDSDIHWLKIDVEGFERQTLASWQNSPKRPWIVVIEATYPKTRTPTFGEWQDLILAKGYSLAYDDGLNHFYLSNEHPELSDHLRQPPNVFDEFQVNPSGSSLFSKDMKDFFESEIFWRGDRIVELEKELAEARCHLADSEQRGNDQTAIHEKLNQDIREASERADHLAGRLTHETERADQLIARLLNQEASHAQLLHREVERTDQLMAQLLSQETAYSDLLSRETARANRLAGELSTRIDQAHSATAILATTLGNIVASTARNRWRPWPLRAFTHGVRLPPVQLPITNSAFGGIGTPLSLSQVMSLPQEQFLQSAYLLILGRDIDQQGQIHYGERLRRSGISRRHVLVELARSREALRRRSGADLDGQSDEAFIDAIYPRLLGRAADVEGQQHFLKRLRQGISRATVMSDLRKSAEGRRHSAKFDDELETLVLRRTSLFGWRAWLRPSPATPLDTTLQPAAPHATSDLAGVHEALNQIRKALDDEAQLRLNADNETATSMQDQIRLLAAALEGAHSRQ